MVGALSVNTKSISVTFYKTVTNLQCWWVRQIVLDEHFFSLLASRRMSLASFCWPLRVNKTLNNRQKICWVPLSKKLRPGECIDPCFVLWLNYSFCFACSPWASIPAPPCFSNSWTICYDFPCFSLKTFLQPLWWRAKGPCEIIGLNILWIKLTLLDWSNCFGIQITLQINYYS